MFDITQEQVKHLFDYQDSGNLIRRVSVSKNTKAGEEAGCVGNRGYKSVMIDNTSFRLHRLIFLWHNGYLPEFIDHIDGNPSNNRIENLRECTNSENKWNQKISKFNTSGVKGVCWSKAMGKWRAQIEFNKKYRHLGYFDNLQEAKELIEKERVKYHGEFANHG